MDRPSEHALRVERAKQQLRQTAESTNIFDKKLTPYIILATASIGFLLGKKELPRNFINLLMLKKLLA